MSSFEQDIVYAIIPTSGFSTEMQNMVRASVNADIDALRRNDDGTKTVVIFITQFSAPFGGYQWYDRDQIGEELLNDEWQ